MNLITWLGREIHQDVFLGKDVFLGQGPQSSGTLLDGERIVKACER